MIEHFNFGVRLADANVGYRLTCISWDLDTSFRFPETSK
jgi:hypothetical protein